MTAKTRTRAASRSADGASSLQEWKRRSLPTVTLSSGTVVTLRPLTLDELAGSEALPDDLLRVALMEQIPGGVVAEIAQHLHEGTDEALAAAKELSSANLKLRDELVLKAVISPRLQRRDLAELDPFDKAEIAEIAQRRRGVDAAGKPIGPDQGSYLHAWREAHDCAPDCPHCEAVLA